MLYTFVIVWFLDRFGSGEATVVAHNPVEALAAASASESGWMLLDPHVRVSRIERRFLAHCEHLNGEGVDENTMQCDDCGLTYRSVWGEDNEHPEPSATAQGFRAYCANLTVR